MVYYRKYRPQIIAELDSPKLRETLTAVLSAKEIPHAFLFTGPKGLGKTSTARIVAKVLNCTSPKRDGIEPCNQCEQCVSITNGVNIDVLEIDGASNRGIDEIRELRERINLAPSSARKKVYIIDEVHMLTTEAFNALLKTIEEPPSHVVFIFATTEPQKVPATIISRCFHVSLQKATDEELIHSLKRIVENEKIAIDDDALLEIAKMAEGGYRDSQKLFEEVVALSSGKQITKHMVAEATGSKGVAASVLSLLHFLEKKDVKAALGIIEKLVANGTEIRYFLSQLLETLHEELLAKAGALGDKKPFTAFHEDELFIFIPLISDVARDLKFAPIQQLPLELAIVKWCSESEQEVQNQGNTVQSHMVSGNKPSLQDMRRMEQNLKVKHVLGKGESEEKIEPIISSHVQIDLPKDIKDVNVLLENLIYKVKPYNHSVAGVLRSCRVQLMTDKEVVFETAYAFHKERLEDNKAQEIVEKALREITGKTLKISVALKK